MVWKDRRKDAAVQGSFESKDKKTGIRLGGVDVCRYVWIEGTPMD